MPPAAFQFLSPFSSKFACIFEESHLSLSQDKSQRQHQPSFNQQLLLNQNLFQQHSIIKSLTLLSIDFILCVNPTEAPLTIRRNFQIPNHIRRRSPHHPTHKPQTQPSPSFSNIVRNHRNGIPNPHSAHDPNPTSAVAAPDQHIIRPTRPVPHQLTEHESPIPIHVCHTG
ncbi:hypothetical protein VTL71DRAFT_12890, partial [Oculimacula yallundae]